LAMMGQRRQVIGSLLHHHPRTASNALSTTMAAIPMQDFGCDDFYFSRKSV
jgi:hypothetical protein